MIRKGTFDDVAAIAEIFNYYVQTSTVIFSNTLLSADDMKQKLAPIVGQFPFYVWEEDGKVLGYCYAHKFHPAQAIHHDFPVQRFHYLQPQESHPHCGS